MNISQLTDKAWEAIEDSRILSEAYLIIDQINDQARSLKINKHRKEKELESLSEKKKNAVLWSPPSGGFDEILSLYRGTKPYNGVDQKEMDRMEKEINNLREELSNLRETERLLPKTINKLTERLEKLEDPATHKKIGYKQGYHVGYKNNEDVMQLSAYSLLEPPDDISLAGAYKRRNEIIRTCKQYYEDGYKSGKRSGQSERKEIMGE